MSNLDIWHKFDRPPPTALKQIGGGRLRGKSDINPQWRYEAMTAAFGPCGIGWKFTIDERWTEPGNGETFAFVKISLYVRDPRGATSGYAPEWSEAIPGMGGSMLLQKESGGIHNNDEAYKMATTDALGTAMKLLGVAAEVYKGNWDGTKYKETPEEEAARLKAEYERSNKATADPQLAERSLKILAGASQQGMLAFEAAWKTLSGPARKAVQAVYLDQLKMLKEDAKEASRAKEVAHA